MRRKNIFYIFIIIFTVIISTYMLFYSFLPKNISIIKNSNSIISVPIPLKLYVKNTSDDYTKALKINGDKITDKIAQLETNKKISVFSNEIGEYLLEIKLFKFLPLKTVKVNVIPEVEVYPGGQAIGVLLKSEGIMVVDISSVKGEDGRNYYPGKKAGIEVGDKILEVNGKKINDKFELLNYIQNYNKGKKLTFKIEKKNKNIKYVSLEAVKNYCGDYMVGLYIDDGVAGVGTLSFYTKATKEYAALGHIITESKAGTKIDIRTGHIVEANISGISGSKNGYPGEKLGSFFQTKNIIGNITKNNEFGIYGQLIEEPSIKNNFFDEPLDVALRSSVELGPAKMYTVIKGNEIEEFDVNIERIYYQHSPAAKSMVIKITDPELNNLTGGIVQGMSGSPLVQNNMLIGAVTHVFINNPQKGYGVFAEWMLKNLNENNLKKIS